MKKEIEITNLVLVKISITDPKNIVIEAFLKWQKEKGIYAFQTLLSGGGLYVALWLPKDAKKVKVFLAKRPT